MIIGANLAQTGGGRLGGIEGFKGKINIKNYLESIDKIIQLGYEQIELSSDPLLIALKKDELKKLMDELLKYQRSTGIKYSVHLPFWTVNVATHEEDIRKSSVKVIKDFINLVHPLQPTHYVLHVFQGVYKNIEASRADESVKKEVRERVYNYARESVQEIITVLDDSHQLAIENLVGSKLEYLIDLREECNTSFCYDIGHKYITDMDEISFIENYHEHIRAIHAHNIQLLKTDKNKDEFSYRMKPHNSISEGIIDFERVLSTLQKVNYQYSLIIEVFQYASTVSSAEYLKKRHIVEDYF